LFSIFDSVEIATPVFALTVASVQPLSFRRRCNALPML
jgi:hypothetical protein